MLRGPRAKPASGPVGLVLQHGAEFEILRAETYRIANAKRQPVHEEALHHDAGQGLGRQRLRERHGRVKHDLAIERIGPVDATHLRQGALGLPPRGPR